jgi:hypothetical protein
VNVSFFCDGSIQGQDLSWQTTKRINNRVLFLASEYVSKQVRVVPSINRPTRVNPSVFCSLKKEP